MQTTFQYTIKFDDKAEQSFVVELDSNTGLIVDNDQESADDWTLLEYHKCQHCPYSTDQKKYCPVAKNLSKASLAFKDERSYKKLTVFVKTNERMYGKKTDLQTALFSLFGLIMATSSCQHMQVFKSMARFHLPFSSMEETTTRVLGMHLISEYLKLQNDPAHKISLDGLVQKYENINLVNQGIIERIRSLKGGDANQNAIIVLDTFASILPMEIGSGLQEIKPLFDDV